MGILKKVLFIIPTLQGGGAEKLLVDILKNMNYSQYEVQVMYFCEGSVYLEQVPSQVKLMVPFNLKDGLVAKNGRAILKILNLQDPLRKKKIIRSIDNHYDCIISFLEGQALHFHTFIIDRADKNVSYVHTDLSRYKISLNRKSEDEYASMDTIAFVSRPAMLSFEKVFPYNASEHVVMPNMIDIDNVRKRSIAFTVEKDVPTVLCVGRIVRVKGFDILVNVAKYLSETITSFQIRVVGTGDDEYKLKQAIRRCKLTKYFQFEGFQHNPYPFIANADIMLSTSVAEGFSLVICEAMALGVPVISTKTDGASSMLRDGAGILVERNAKDIANAIESLLTDKDLARQYAVRGLKESKKYDKSEYMPKLYEIL